MERERGGGRQKRQNTRGSNARNNCMRKSKERIARRISKVSFSKLIGTWGGFRGVKRKQKRVREERCDVKIITRK